ncbi:MAG: DUF3987 domain-containing protein [Candidatus Nanoarchaeia archaeon]|nr:YfjI family protein [Candidatus Jingweiarchaeum tengchongense]
MDLIDEFVEYGQSACDAPSIYFKAEGYFIVSTLLGRRQIIYTTYSPRGIRPNLWVLLMGPTRLTRKSTSMELAEDIIKQISPSILIPASFSPEGLYELFTGMNEGDAVAWVKDELGGFFKMLEKKYMYGMREILSTIYAGRGETRKLRSITLKIPDKIYVTVSSTIPTPPHYYFSEEDFYSGFMNRFIIAYSTRRERKVSILHNDPRVFEMKEEIIARLKKFCKFYDEVGVVISSFSNDARIALENYEEWVESELVRYEREMPNSLFRFYLSGSVNTLMKMTMLRRIAREPLDGTVLVSEKQDFDKAFADLQEFLECARQVIEDVQTSAISKPVLTEEKNLDRIYNFIQSRRARGATLSEILFEMRLVKSDLSKYLITLIESGKVIAVKARSEGRGRRPIVFISSEHKNFVQNIGEELDSVVIEKILQ